MFFRHHFYWELPRWADFIMCRAQIFRNGPRRQPIDNVLFRMYFVHLAVTLLETLEFHHLLYVDSLECLAPHIQELFAKVLFVRVVLLHV